MGNLKKAERTVVRDILKSSRKAWPVTAFKLWTTVCPALRCVLTECRYTMTGPPAASDLSEMGVSLDVFLQVSHAS